MEFSYITGNDKIKQMLTSILDQNRLSHSYMFLGVEGIGKFLIAKEWAKMILCRSAERKGCHECKSCIEFESGNHPDFYVLDSNGETIKIEQIRQIQVKILEKPIISEKKVYIINDADNMTKEAQNCLLKTLEEPPEFAVIILIGSNEEKFLNTIRSRCTKISFENLKGQELEKILKEKFNMEIKDSYLTEASQGSVKRVVAIYEKKDLYKNIREVFENIENYSILDVLNKLELLYKNKDNIIEILDYIEYLFFQKAKKEVKYIKYIEEIEVAKRNIKANSNYDMQIDRLLFKIWEEKSV